FPMSVSEYQKARRAYEQLAEKARAGDKQAFEDKAKAFAEVRSIERQMAREGKVIRGGEVKEIPDKKSLQAEYVRRFSDSKPADPQDPKGPSEQQAVAKRLAGRK